MLVRLRDISTWVTFMALLLTMLMGSGVTVYCVGSGDHAAIEFAHGEQHRDRPVDGEQDALDVAWTNLGSDSRCVDQPLVEEAIPSSISTSPERVIVSPVSLLYELPDPETLQVFRTFSRWQDTPVHPELSVVQFVVLLI